MKIMQICFAPIVNSAGGAEKVYCNMSNHFVKSNEVVNVCCDSCSGKPFYHLNEKANLINLGEYCDLKVPFFVKVHQEITRLIKRYNENIEWPKEIYIRSKINATLRTLLNNEKPDVVICYELRSMVAVAECGYPLYKMVVMFHMDVDS